MFVVLAQVWMEDMAVYADRTLPFLGSTVERKNLCHAGARLTYVAKKRYEHPEHFLYYAAVELRTSAGAFTGAGMPGLASLCWKKSGDLFTRFGKEIVRAQLRETCLRKTCAEAGKEASGLDCADDFVPPSQGDS